MNKKTNKAKIIIPIIIFIFLVILIPKINDFIQKDICLDQGWSYNSETKKCEKDEKQWKNKDFEINQGKFSQSEKREHSGVSEWQEFLKTLTYSNLTDKPSQEEVKIALQKAGIDEKNIKNFFESVDYYNESIEKTSLNSGFTKIDNLEPKYDMWMISEKWEAKNPDFHGFNCRITSYNLMRNFIKIENPEKQNDRELFVDKEVLETDPNKIFSEEEKEIFKSFYSKIPTTLTKDLSIHIEKVKKDWQEKWVTFPFKWDKNKASLISVFFHNYFDDDDNFLFIGHIWVLLPTEDNKILFVEKISFEDPYQVFRFNNRIELNDYLMNKYDTEYNQPTASPFIFENDEILEGYRANPNKKKS